MERENKRAGNGKKEKIKKGRKMHARRTRQKLLCKLLITMSLLLLTISCVYANVTKSTGNSRFITPVNTLNFVASDANRRAIEKDESIPQQKIPESLMQLYEKNEEARDFVLGYGKIEEQDMDISKEVTKGSIPLFLQWDTRWGYKTYGDDFLAVTGCGPTCLSMVYSGLTGNSDRNPYEMAKLAEKKGYYVEGSGSSWSMMEELAEELGLLVKNVIFDKEHIFSELRDGNPIICIMGPGEFTDSGHFIILSELSEDGKIIIRDPNSIVNTQKEWDLEEIMYQIRNLWSYSYSR